MIAKRLLTWGIHGVPVATVGLLASWYVWYAAAARLDLSPWLALAGDGQHCCRSRDWAPIPFVIQTV